MSIPLYIGRGSLSFDYLGIAVTDGVQFFKVLSLGLRLRLRTPKARREKISGVWLAVGDKIVWFRKEKYTYGQKDKPEVLTRKRLTEVIYG